MNASKLNDGRVFFRIGPIGIGQIKSYKTNSPAGGDSGMDRLSPIKNRPAAVALGDSGTDRPSPITKSSSCRGLWNLQIKSNEQII